jgi:hypothetical protein
MFGCAARFDLSAPPMNGRRFQAPPAVGQLLPPARTADLSEDGETLDSDDDDDDLPSVKQILASSKRAKRVVDLTEQKRKRIRVPLWSPIATSKLCIKPRISTINATAERTA